MVAMEPTTDTCHSSPSPPAVGEQARRRPAALHRCCCCWLLPCWSSKIQGQRRRHGCHRCAPLAAPAVCSCPLASQQRSRHRTTRGEAKNSRYPVTGGGQWGRCKYPTLEQLETRGHDAGVGASL